MKCEALYIMEQKLTVVLVLKLLTNRVYNWLGSVWRNNCLGRGNLQWVGEDERAFYFSYSPLSSPRKSLTSLYHTSLLYHFLSLLPSVPLLSTHSPLAFFFCILMFLFFVLHFLTFPLTRRGSHADIFRNSARLRFDLQQNFFML